MRKGQNVSVKNIPSGCQNPGKILSINKDKAVVQFNEKFNYIIPKTDLTII